MLARHGDRPPKHSWARTNTHIHMQVHTREGEAQLVKGPYVCMADASSDLQHLCKELCVQRHMPIYSRHCGDGHRRTLGAFWLASLAERASSGLSERPCWKKKLESSQHQPLASMCPPKYRKYKEKYIKYK